MSAANTDTSNSKNYLLSLSAMSILFFLWGFITVLNDVLIPKLKAVFDLSYTEAMLIQFCFFGAYFIVSLPAGYLVKKVGYKKGVITGLITAAIGCSLFYPATAVHEYVLFLGALFVLASGVTILQVSANPYVAVLGSEKTASSRLNLAQALNSLGTTVGPWVGGMLFFSGTSALVSEAAQADAVKVPYLMLAGALVAIAIFFALLKLPEIHSKEHASENKQSLLKASQLVFGVLAIFFYVGGEVSIGSFLINYLGEQHIAALEKSKAAEYITYYWGGAMVGRFIGAFLMRSIEAHKILVFNAISVVILLIVTMTSSGQVAMYSVLTIGLFNSIMFPTIFALAITGLDTQTSKGASWLCLAIVGGALVPLVQGIVADSFHVQASFIIPTICYIYIIGYAAKANGLITRWTTQKAN